MVHGFGVGDECEGGEVGGTDFVDGFGPGFDMEGWSVAIAEDIDLGCSIIARCCIYVWVCEARWQASKADLQHPDVVGGCRIVCGRFRSRKMPNLAYDASLLTLVPGTHPVLHDTPCEWMVPRP